MSHPDFIFMLTRNDRTVAGAAEYLETALEAGVRHMASRTSASRWKSWRG